jgi:hypothetical protein
MHAFGTIATANMMYIKSQNHTNMVVGKHGIQILKVVVVVMLLLMLSIDGFCPYKCTSRINLDKWFAYGPCPSMKSRVHKPPQNLFDLN